MAFYPYLFLGRDCREAFEFYKQVFGGELVLITMNDMPSDQPVRADQGDLIAHAALKFEDDQLLMGSDDPTTDNPGPVTGMMVNYSVPDVDAATKALDVFRRRWRGEDADRPDRLVAGVRDVRRSVRHAVDGQRRPGGVWDDRSSLTGTRPGSVAS